MLRYQMNAHGEGANDSSWYSRADTLQILPRYKSVIHNNIVHGS